MKPYSFRILWFLLGWLVMGTATSTVHAGITTLGISQTVNDTTVSVRTRQVAIFRISYSVNSTTEGAKNATISFLLDKDLELVAMKSSGDVKLTSYNATTRMGVFAFEKEMDAGTSGELAVQVRFAQTTTEGTVANFQPIFAASNALPALANPLAIIAIDPPLPSSPPSSPTFIPGVKVVKTGPGSVASESPYWDYTIRHGNTGDAASGVPLYMIEDTFPAGTKLTQFSTDRFTGTSNGVTVKYKTNLNAAWSQWGASPLYFTGDSSQKTYYPKDIGLTTSAEYVTALRFEYGSVPGGGPFLPTNNSRQLLIRLSYITGKTTETSLLNCATVSGTDVPSQTGCTTASVRPSLPNYFIAGREIASFPLEMSEEFSIEGRLGHFYDSNAAMVNPVLMVLLPYEFEYVGNLTLTGAAWNAAPVKNMPTLEKFENFKGTGKTLLRWKWTPNNPFIMDAIEAQYEFQYTFKVRVRPGTPNARFSYRLHASWQSPAPITTQWQVTDTDDLNGNGSTTETLLSLERSVPVETNGGLASVSSTMEVKGELDAAWSKFPATGLTVPSGKADYQLSITNTGGVIMKDPVVIDILPTVGDRGVIDASPRGSEWEPFLAGEVTVPTGITVYYSKSKNPCRNELTPGLPVGCEDPKWSIAPPADITQVHSLKFDGTGLRIMPLDTLKINWPMRAPINAPTGGEIAWNSFGMVLKRADDGTSTMPTEPVKTGIAVKPPDPPYYGDRVWLDANRNGIQDRGETGINGVRVQLYRDNGDGKADPSSDTQIAFTVTSTVDDAAGFYRFGNMGPGDYFAVVIPPDDYGITTPNVGSDDALDSDGDPIYVSGRRAAVFPVTTLVTKQEDLTWDLGIYDRSGIPSVWAIAPLADGRLMLGGRFTATHALSRKNIARVFGDGKADSSFDPGTGFDGSVRSLAVRSDGLVWAGGNFTTYNNQAAVGVALLKSNGALAGSTVFPDTSNVNWVGVQGTRMLMAGSFGKVGEVPCGNIAALKADGTFDSSFPVLPGGNAAVNGGTLLADGSLILAGAFTSFHGVPRGRVVKLRSNGTVDLSFNPGAGANGEVFSITPLEDGRLVLTGAFTNFSGLKCNGTIRLMPDGKPDPTLSASALSVKSINTSN